MDPLSFSIIGEKDIFVSWGWIWIFKILLEQQNLNVLIQSGTKHQIIKNKSYMEQFPNLLFQEELSPNLQNTQKSEHFFTAAEWRNCIFFLAWFLFDAEE